MRTLHRTKVATERALARYAFQSLLLAFALQRGWTALQARTFEEPVIVACFAMQAVVGMLAAAAVMTQRFVIGSLAILGTTVTLTGLLFLLVSSGMSASLALTHVFITVLAVMILANFVRDSP
jgi:hypothetical protein